jgi:septum formation protein
MRIDAGSKGSTVNLVLASTSSYRRALLERLGIAFRAIDPGVDEAAYKTRGLPPRELAEALARAKAEAVDVDGIVIGSDQVATIDGAILGKPGTVASGIAQLELLNGREHHLITALAVRHRGGTIVHTDVTTLAMRCLSAEAIARYVEADRPLDCAGSYKIEARGIALFERIDTADATAIVGLPLIALTTILRSLGLEVP